MKFCGLCHTDVHHARNEAAPLMPARYPCVPGHELAGVCIAIGSAVTRIAVGDHVGVGCMVDSCLKCAACLRGDEQLCSAQVATYGAAPTPRSAVPASAPQHTLGGYTSAFVVHERFAIRIPKAYPLEAAGPVMCAGVTLWSPLRKYKAGPGTRVAIVGMGGLGAMGIKLARALGAHVTALTRSPAKAAFAVKCGAQATLLSSDAAAMAAARGGFDLVLNTIPVEHAYGVYSALVAPRGKHVLLGLHSGLVAGIVADLLTCGGSSVVGSGIGGIACTQEVMDLCAAQGILPELRVIQPQGIAGAYEALAAGNESGERYVCDLASLKDGSAFAACEAVAPPRLPPQQPPISVCDIIGGIFKLVCCSCRR
jgi:uncharacterized zinc-type alcohol dehydrogenase-like protein